MTPVSALPFPRGDTMSQGGAMTLSDTSYQDLEGKIFWSHDAKHNTGRGIKLRVVKNDTGGDITVTQRFMGFSLGANDFGARAAEVSAAGEVCKPIDDMYAIGFTIPDDDLFYVIEEGPCYVLTETSTVALDAGNVVATDSTGFVNGTPCVQASEYAAGSIGPQAVTAATAIIVYIDAGLSQIGT